MKPRVPTPVVRGMLRRLALWAFTPTSWPQRRQRTELVARALIAPRGTTLRHASVAGVPVEWISGPNANTSTLLLYLHGGGYTSGSPRSHRAIAATLAREMGATAVVPEYRLAPEHPFPAGPDDVMSVYRALLDHGHRAENIVVAGDSAGGGLALGLGVAARDQGLPLPRAIVLICPWLDLEPQHPWPTRSGEPLLTPDGLTEFAEAYATPVERAASAVSPIRADLRGLPTLFIESAADDPIAEDALVLAQRARVAGVDVRHRHHRGLWHAFHVLLALLPEANDAVAELGKALHTHVNGSLPPAATNQENAR